MPHNVTIEMDLALWEVARSAEPYREILLNTPPSELAAVHLAGNLPDFGLDAFLERYGIRSAAEVDIGVPRWAENPALVFTMLANYLRVTDPEQAPDRRFNRAADRAESMLTELARRARREHALRGRLAGFFLRRSRELTGLREAGKFAGLYALRDRRRRLLLIGAELHAKGLVARPDDAMFLELPELRTVVETGADLRDTIVARRTEYERELRRRTAPVLDPPLPVSGSHRHPFLSRGTRNGGGIGAHIRNRGPRGERRPMPGAPTCPFDHRPRRRSTRRLVCHPGSRTGPACRCGNRRRGDRP
ncbi:hypothetical protein [Streptomyces sp. NPDC048248]|uniref:hypothetical protein n=1 Tax=Streptomyces sp. NPDC048248 TaxID=3365523 RepID=UPI00372424EF